MPGNIDIVVNQVTANAYVGGTFVGGNISGNIVTGTQPYITDLPGLVTVTTAQDFNVGRDLNVVENIIVQTGSITMLDAVNGNIFTNANIVASEQIYGGANIVAQNYIVAAQGDIIGNLVAGSIATDNFTFANGAPFTGNISDATIDAQITALLPTYSGTLSPSSLTTPSIVVGNIQTSGTFQANNISVSNVATIGGNVFVGKNLTTTGNITAPYYYGNLAYATGIPAANTSYNNSNVETFLSTNQMANNISILGNSITFGATVPTGSGLDGMGIKIGSAGDQSITYESFRNGWTVNRNLHIINDVSAGANIIATGNLIGASLEIAVGGTLTSPDGTSGDVIIDPDGVGLFIVTDITPTVMGNTVNMKQTLSVDGNITSNAYYYGNGAFLTGVASSYGNAEVSDYLASYDNTNGYKTTGSINVGKGPAIHDAEEYASTPTEVTLSWSTFYSPVPYVVGEYVTVSGVTAPDPVGLNGVWEVSAADARSVTILNTEDPGTGTFTTQPTITGTDYFGTIDVYGDVTALNFYGNGAGLTGLPAGYTDANVTTLLSSGNVTSNVITTGNISGGNIGTTGEIVSIGNVTTIGNVSGNYFIGNGAFLTGLQETYGNAQVANFLSSGNANSNIVTTGNIVGSYIYGDGSNLTRLVLNATSSNIVITNADGNVLESQKYFSDVDVNNQAIWSSNQTESYVQQAFLNIPSLPPVNLATTANVTAKTGNVTVDGVTTVPGNYLLLKNQTNNDNGVWLAQSGAWIRQIYDGSSYANVTTETTYSQLGTNNGVLNVIAGTANKNLQFQITAVNPSATFGNSVVYVTATTKLPIASVTNRYVDIANGNDTTNNGSSSFPFATLSRALTGASFPLSVNMGTAGASESSAITWTSAQQNTVVQAINAANDGGQTSMTGVQTFATGSTRNDFVGFLVQTGASVPYVFQSGALFRNYFQNLTIVTTAATWMTIPTNAANFITFDNINIANYNPLILPSFTNQFTFYINNQSAIMPITGPGRADTYINVAGSCSEDSVRVAPGFLGYISWNNESYEGKIGSTAFPTGVISNDTDLTTITSWVTDATYDGAYWIRGFTPANTNYRTNCLIGKQTAFGQTSIWYVRFGDQLPVVINNIINEAYVTSTDTNSYGNISSNYVTGNGRFLTGVAGAYGNADVSNYLASGTANANIITTADMSANNLSITNVTTTRAISVNSDFTQGDTTNPFLPHTRIVTDTSDPTTYIQVGTGTSGTTGNVIFSPFLTNTQAVVINTTLGNITAAGNISGNYFLGNGALLSGLSPTSIFNGNSNVSIPAAGGSINFNVGGVSAGYIVGNGTVALGTLAGIAAQGANSVAIGYHAGGNGQSVNAVAIGVSAGNVSQSSAAVAIGNQAGNSSQGSSSVAIGQQAGQTSQGANDVAIGNGAGGSSQGTLAVAVGALSGASTQGQGGIAVGALAGQQTQGANAIAIGRQAGTNAQGTNSIAIGKLAGNSSQAGNTIIISATGNELNGIAAQQNSLYIDPVRADTANVFNVLYYNTSSKEVTYGAGVQGGFAKYTRGAGQTGIINPGTVINCDVVQAAVGTDITVNTGTGQITLQPGKTYRLRGSVPSWIGSIASLQVCWYNETTAQYAGNSAENYSPTSSAQYGTMGGAAEWVFTPNATTTVSFRVLACGAVTSLGANTDFNAAGNYPWIDIEVIGGQAAITSQAQFGTVTSPLASGAALGTTSANAVTVLTYNIPTAGTWQMDAVVSSINATSAQMLFALYANGVLVPNTTTVASYVAGAGTQSSGTASWVQTTSGSATYTVRAWALSGSGTLLNDTSGYTYGSYNQIAGLTAYAGVPNWTNTTIQAAGISATTTAPTLPTTTIKNNIAYKQLGPKTWQVIGNAEWTNTTGAVIGNGDYLFTLPAGLSFDTTLPFQSAYQGDVGANATSFIYKSLTGSWSFMTNDTTYTNGYQPGIIPWDATRYRISLPCAGTAFRCWGSLFFGTTGLTRGQWTFTFQTP